MSLALPIVLQGNPVLHTAAQEVPVEEIASPKIQELIQNMIHTMRNAPGAGLAAPQVGESLQIAVIEYPKKFLAGMPAEVLLERGMVEVPLHVIINPELTLIETAGTAEFFEGCLSVGDKRGIIPRAKAVEVRCLNEKGEQVLIKAEGWFARILQHEIGHLCGELFVDKAFPETLMTEEEYQTNWRSKTIDQIKTALFKSEELTE